MSIELRSQSNGDTVLNFQPAHGNRTLPLVCPSCQNAITLSPGLCGNRLIQAILLQSQRIGTELDCNHCGLRFVFHKAQTEGMMRTSRNVREKIGSIYQS